MAWNGQRERATRLASQLGGAAMHATRGWLAADTRQIPRARTFFAKAFELDPQNAAARAGLIRCYSRDFFAKLPDDIPFTEREQAVLRAVKLRIDQKWDEIMKIDSSLAEIGPDDMLYGSAISMRGLWRIQIGTKKQAREAVDLYDQVLTRHRTRENYYHRVRAAAAAGETEMTWVGLNHFTDRANIGPPYVVRELLSIVRDLGQPPPLHAEVPGRLNQAARAAGRGRAQL